jgi:hypothetical protein
MLNFFRRSRIKVVEAATQEVLTRRKGRPTEHGGSIGGVKSPTYACWCNAKNGAKLSEEFAQYKDFLKYMGERPRGYMLARRDESKLHSSANSFWKKRTIY